MERILAVLGLAVLCNACGVFGGCELQTQTLELVYSDTFYDIRLKLLNDYRADGWSCKDDGAIRDGFGRTIGTRYVCTKCK